MTTFGVPMFASSIFILMIAVDRYLLIVYPFKRRMGIRCTVLVAVLIVGLTIAMSVPLIVYTKMEVVRVQVVQMHKIVCMENWPSYRVKQVRAICSMQNISIECFHTVICTKLLSS